MKAASVGNRLDPTSGTHRNLLNSRTDTQWTLKEQMADQQLHTCTYHQNQMRFEPNNLAEPKYCPSCELFGLIQQNLVTMDGRHSLTEWIDLS
jgi:hypothetical protein